jgi:predicted metal-dependent HD superfamily phosphohydrolase
MDPAAIEELPVRWRQAVAPFGAPAELAGEAYTDLATRYCEPGRFYHTLEHIAAFLDVLQGLGDSPAALALAAWYHDAVYDSRAADNEERSAGLARESLPRLGVPAAVIEETVRLILLTKTHRTGEDDVAGRRFLDADLAILGADPESYDLYAAAIRREYAWVPEADYRAGRRRVLEGFLARPQVYYLLKHLEPTARDNLRREADQLGGK